MANSGISLGLEHKSQTIVCDLKLVDTLDDRREIWHLLHRLHPRRRFAFLQFLCQQCYLPGSRIHPQASWFRMGPRVAAAVRGNADQDRALTTEIYTDVMVLVCQYGLSAKWAAERLEGIVKERAG